MIIDRQGNVREEQIIAPAPELKRCSFERIYFSRGSDKDIYTMSDRSLVDGLSRVILDKLDSDVRPVVFSYIPNTAATSFYGVIDGVYKYIDRYKREAILNWAKTQQQKSSTKY